MNRMTRLILCIVLFFGLHGGGLGSLAAHPLAGITRVDRTVAVRLDVQGAYVRYNIELNDWTLFNDAKTILTDEDRKDISDPRSMRLKYVEKKARLVADQLLSSLNGEEIRFRVSKSIIDRVGDHYRLQFELVSPWNNKVQKDSNHFSLKDHNFERYPGRLIMTIDTKKVHGALDILSLEEPLDLRDVASNDLSLKDQERRRCVAAVFRLLQEAQGSESKSDNTQPVIEDQIEEESTLKGYRDRGLHSLFESHLGLGLLLLLAAVFGMAHAFTPGHGKTMVAAYLVGEQGTFGHAVVLGLVTTITHTGSVILLSVIIYSVYGNQPPTWLQGWLNILGGLLILLVGFWLLLQRLRGRADHVHLFTGNHHHTSDSTLSSVPGVEETKRRSVGWYRVMLLGLAGGIIPCWDAIMLFLVGMTYGQVGLAIQLLLSFSLGLAVVLVGLGLSVVWATKKGKTRFGETQWFRYLPILSALLLTLLGFLFMRDGVIDLTN